jgi:hypothetical protein
MENQLILISPPPLKPLEDPRPESTAFTNIKLFNHLLEHLQRPKNKYCSIDCMTKEFEGRSYEGARAKMRQRLSAFQRWAREEMETLIVVPKAFGNGHGEALAAKIFDSLAADDRDRELVADDLNRARQRKEITEETYEKKFNLVYPMLNENQNEKGEQHMDTTTQAPDEPKPEPEPPPPPGNGD